MLLFEVYLAVHVFAFKHLNFGWHLMIEDEVRMSDLFHKLERKLDIVS